MNAGPEWYESKPVAAVGDLGTDGEWVECELSTDQVDVYRAVTGASNTDRDDGLPQGALPMLARLAYLAGHRAPPGGVLTRLEWSNHAPPPADGRMLARSEVVDDAERRGRRRVVVGVELADRERAPVAFLAWHLLWPEGMA